MLKKIVNTLIILLFWAAFYFIVGALLNLVMPSLIIFLFGFVLTLVFISLVYKKNWYINKLKTKWGKLFLFASFFVFFLFTTYFKSNYDRSKQLYEYMTSKGVRGWEGIAHVADQELGYKPLENARAFHVFPIGKPIPMAYDKDGFRVPMSDTNKNNVPGKVDILFLGCSFTYGDACYADSTFAHLTSRVLNMSYINAGVCGYGLEHMFIRSKILIKKYRPKYVVFQYSDWLVKRALSPYAPVYIGRLPTPYFSNRNGEIKLNKPYFKTQVFDMDKKEIANKYKNHFVFYINKGLSFFIYDDFNASKYYILTKLKRIDWPNADKEELTIYAYTQMLNEAVDNGAIPIVLHLQSDNKNVELSENLVKFFSNYNYIDTELKHKEYLMKHTNYDRKSVFTHWGKDINGDSIKVDLHPNNISHRLISKTLIEKITNKITK
jgi:hypothetical protein